jgi:hypothetical protein
MLLNQRARAHSCRPATAQHGAPQPGPSNNQASIRMHVPRLKFEIDSLFVTKMLAMALLLHERGGLLGGMGGEVAGVGGSGARDPRDFSGGLPRCFRDR